ncbi:MAG: dihydropteroate synthase [Arenibacterium sp.]
MIYYRPLVQHGAERPDDAVTLAGGPLWFTRAEAISRAGDIHLVSTGEIPENWLCALSNPRSPLLGMDLSTPRLMGIVNVTPDSFSDGGLHFDTDAAVAAAQAMQGADILDIGGESTRPGAAEVPVDEEISRTAPVIRALREKTRTPISIDTRKKAVAEAAVQAGAGLVNDVSGFTFDPALAPFCADADLPVCVMHAQGDPETMQKNPHYNNVLLDVFDVLETQVRALEQAGIPRSRILVDPGIGFGKTVDHNLTLLKNISLFHGLGCAILLGVSRKRFIGTLSDTPDAQARAPGSVAVGLAALAQGVQILRVHDVAATRQALTLWQAVR